MTENRILKDADTVAPAESAGFQRVLHQAQQDGIERDALCRLFWLMNAHPRLLGHQRCLQNLRSLLSTPEFVDGVDAWAGPWTSDVPGWLAITDWACRLGDTAKPGMEDFVRPPRNERHHLLMRHGINRHPGAGALWIRHHDDPNPMTHTAGLSSASRSFRLLQWHLFCSQAEARREHSTLDQYMSYSGDNEWPTWPRPAAAVGLALRDLSYQRWDGMLSTLPFEPQLDEFAKALVEDKDQLLTPYQDPGETRQRVVALISYFEDFHNLFEGRPNKPRRERGGGRGGARTGVPGYVHFASSPQVFFQPPEQDTGDEDVPSRDFTRVHLHSDALTPGRSAELESQDIAPGEDLRPVMDLFPAAERPGGMSSLWMRRDAMDAAAQHHFWDKTQMTPLETSALLDVLGEPSRAAAADSESTLATEARLLLKTMLVFGCPFEEARTIRAMTLSRFTEAVTNHSVITTRIVVVTDNGDECAGLALPALSPQYKSPPPNAFKTTANGAQHSLTLPDIAGVGASLLSHRSRASEDINGPVFQASAADLETQIKQLLAGVNRQLDASSRARVTITKVAGKLASILGRGGLDEVGVALVCGDQRYAGQARLHYTQHPTNRLIQAYTKATKRLLAEADHPIRVQSPLKVSETSAAVGARLIVRHRDLRQFINQLSAEIESKPAPTQSGRHRYHQSFLLYSMVMQSLMTCVRPSSNPDRFIADMLSHRKLPARALDVRSIVEKDDHYQARARAVVIPDRLKLQLDQLAAHTHGIWRWRPTDLVLPECTDAQLMFLDWPRSVAAPRANIISPDWLTDQLQLHDLPAAANFHRGYLRTRLLTQGCPEQVIDAFLGHANAGQSPYNLHGTLDHDHYLREISSYLDRVAEDLGLVPLRSLLANLDVDFEAGKGRKP